MVEQEKEGEKETREGLDADAPLVRPRVPVALSLQRVQVAMLQCRTPMPWHHTPLMQRRHT